MTSFFKLTILLIALSHLNLSRGFAPPGLHRQKTMSSRPTSSGSNNQKYTTPFAIRNRNNNVSKTNKNGVKSKEPSDAEDESSIMGIFKKSPGTIIMAPFVLLFGLDLILNILVVTKRSLEVFFTGEYTVWTPWQ